MSKSTDNLPTLTLDRESLKGWIERRKDYRGYVGIFKAVLDLIESDDLRIASLEAALSKPVKPLSFGEDFIEEVCYIFTQLEDGMSFRGRVAYALDRALNKESGDVAVWDDKDARIAELEKIVLGYGEDSHSQKSRQVIERLAYDARIAELEARLEIDPTHPYDGICARDETIRILERRIVEKDARIAELESEVKRLKSIMDTDEDMRNAEEERIEGLESDIKRLEAIIDLQEDKEISYAGRIAWLVSRIADEEKTCEHHMNQHDAAEEALAYAYRSVIGVFPEWSNLFGYDDAKNQIDTRCSELRDLTDRESGKDTRIALLEERLEIDPTHLYDGIYARDETIRNLDRLITEKDARIAQHIRAKHHFLEHIAGLETAARDKDARIAELKQLLVKEEKSFTKMIDECDAIEDTLNQAFYLITGEHPVWSSRYCHKEFLKELSDCCDLLKKSATPIDDKGKRIVELGKQVADYRQECEAHITHDDEGIFIANYFDLRREFGGDPDVSPFEVVVGWKQKAEAHIAELEAALKPFADAADDWDPDDGDGDAHPRIDHPVHGLVRTPEDWTFGDLRRARDVLRRSSGK